MGVEEALSGGAVLSSCYHEAHCAASKHRPRVRLDVRLMTALQVLQVRSRDADSKILLLAFDGGLGTLLILRVSCSYQEREEESDNVRQTRHVEHGHFDRPNLGTGAAGTLIINGSAPRPAVAARDAFEAAR